MRIPQKKLLQLPVNGLRFWLECRLICKLGTSDSGRFGGNSEESPQYTFDCCVKLKYIAYRELQVKLHKAPLTF